MRPQNYIGTGIALLFIAVVVFGAGSAVTGPGASGMLYVVAVALGLGGVVLTIIGAVGKGVQIGQQD